jgi:SAM-dependent methyltransferase
MTGMPARVDPTMTPSNGAGTAPASGDPEAITDQVRDRYADAARAVLERRDTPSDAAASCCGPTGGAVFGEILYDASDRAALPDAAVLASLGCGNPTAVAELRPGEVVLDLGSGGGIDVLLSAARVGPTGFAYGLDMTDEMLTLARRNAAEAGATNVEFRKGRMESIPLGDDSVDVVISNCVVNLSTDKAAVLAEIARVLRPGGRVGISDVVADDHLSPDERAQRGSFVGCIAGALSFAEYSAGLQAVGLVDASVTPTHAVADGLHGAIIQARKPADWSMASVRPVQLPRPSTGTLPVLASGGGCGDGCGCA